MYLMWYAAAKSLQSCPTLCDPIDGSLPGSPVPGILQARTQMLIILDSYFTVLGFRSWGRDWTNAKNKILNLSFTDLRYLEPLSFSGCVLTSWLLFTGFTKLFGGKGRKVRKVLNTIISMLRFVNYKLELTESKDQRLNKKSICIVQSLGRLNPGLL